MILFYKRIKELRIEQNLSTRELSDIIGVSPAVVRNWENNKTEPNYEQLLKISNFFNVKCDYLLGLKDTRL